MANVLVPPPEVDTVSETPVLRPLANVHLNERSTMEEPGIFASLWGNLRDVFFPEKLPPLVLESKPIPVIDRMATKQNPVATGSSVAIYALLILLIGWLLHKKVPIMSQLKPMEVVNLEAPPPPKAPPKAVAMGGGGGQKGPTPVVKGTPPKFADQQIVPPKAPPLEEPKIHIQPTLEVQKDLKMPSSLPVIGMANSPLVGTFSGGGGHGTGLGPGSGAGLGPGSGGNYGGGPRRIGGGVSGPQVISSVEPEFSEEARKAKVQGNVLVALWVDTNGNPTHVRVLRGIGMGLDEKAIEAVRQYKFRPGMENGKPVVTEVNIDINFQIF